MSNTYTSDDVVTATLKTLFAACPQLFNVSHPNMVPDYIRDLSKNLRYDPMSGVISLSGGSLASEIGDARTNPAFAHYFIGSSPTSASVKAKMQLLSGKKMDPHKLLELANAR